MIGRADQPALPAVHRRRALSRPTEDDRDRRPGRPRRSPRPLHVRHACASSPASRRASAATATARAAAARTRRRSSPGSASRRRRSRVDRGRRRGWRRTNRRRARRRTFCRACGTRLLLRVASAGRARRTCALACFDDPVDRAAGGPRVLRRARRTGSLAARCRRRCRNDRVGASPASCSPAARAGGWAASTRDWSLLDGRPMVAHVLERLAPQVDAVLINANQNLERYAALRPSGGRRRDRRLRRPARRPARGHRRRRDAQFVVTVPCDSPFLPRGSRRAARWPALGRDGRATSPSRGPSTSRIRCSRSCAATCCRTSPRSSTAAAARSTPGTRRCASSRSPFDDEADAFRNINTRDELAAAARR